MQAQDKTEPWTIGYASEKRESALFEWVAPGCTDHVSGQP